jgi:hypothetical protein
MDKNSESILTPYENGISQLIRIEDYLKTIKNILVFFLVLVILSIILNFYLFYNLMVEQKYK